VLALIALLGVACTASTPAGPSSTHGPPTTESAASTTASTAPSETVHVLGVWSGPELASFMMVKSVWEKDTGGVVDWEGSRNLPADLDADLKAGHPPDIAILPNPGLMQHLAEDGSLVPLNAVLDMKQVTRDYPPAWIDLGSDDGKLYGIAYKVSSKSTVWYNPKAFTAGGYAIPRTWDELIALADTMVADHRTPFSIVAPAGPAPGWALTDWVSQIVLKACGPDRYDRWVAGEIPWTDACIRDSFEKFVQIVHSHGYVRGGTTGILSTSDSDGSYPMYTDPPTAYVYYMASFAQAFIGSEFPDLSPGPDYDAFAFPAIDPAYAGAVMVGADIVVMVNDTPAARSFMAYLAGAQAQEEWVKLGGFTSVNRSVSLDTYADPVARGVAEKLIAARTTRFGAGDLMPAELQRAWWQDMVTLVQNPATLDSTLDSLTEIAKNTG
jgi:alpha-glucoside transport system substrate-binding protein